MEGLPPLDDSTIHLLDAKDAWWEEHDRENTVRLKNFRRRSKTLRSLSQI